MMSLRAEYDAARVRDLASEFETLLDQAEAFARGGDYLGAQARARFAQKELAGSPTRVPDADNGDLRAHLDLRLQRYDRLAHDWRLENDARHCAYVARERLAIGADPAQAGGSDVRQAGLAVTVRRLWAGAFRRWPAGTMRMKGAP